MGGLRAVVSGLAWLVAAAAIALGAAGIVTGMDRFAPGPAGAGGLPASGDALVGTALDAVEADLRDLSVEMDALGVQARGALAALVASEGETAAAAIATGDSLVAAIRVRTARMDLALAELPLIDTDKGRYQVSGPVRDRRARLARALDATREIEASWASLTIASIPASRLSALLAAHDEAVLAAVAAGRAKDYAVALAALDDADGHTVEARRLRDQLARAIDVTTLDAWLDRNAAYDVALRGLYDAVVAADGRVTKAVRQAAQTEVDARANLPGDSRGLVLIMAEIGRGGLNGAVVAIEQARGALAAAVASADDPEASPTP